MNTRTAESGAVDGASVQAITQNTDNTSEFVRLSESLETSERRTTPLSSQATMTDGTPNFPDYSSKSESQRSAMNIKREKLTGVGRPSYGLDAVNATCTPRGGEVAEDRGLELELLQLIQRDQEDDSGHARHSPCSSVASNPVEILQSSNNIDTHDPDEEQLFVSDVDEWTIGNLSLQSENVVDTQSQATYDLNYDEDLPEISPPHISREGEQYYVPAPTNNSDATKEKEMSFFRSQKKKAPKKKTGPRPKSAREWFAKRSKSSQKPLPEVAGTKRKRNEQHHDPTTSQSGGRKRSKKIVAGKHGEKDRQNKKSIKVMTTMVESLLHSNPMEARIAQGDVPEANPITATHKSDQFQQIMQNLPKHADKRSTAADRRRLDEATRSFGIGKCIADDGKWLIKGMKTALFNHQVIGASWMLSREFCMEGPRGGILGDEMGMGKTLQALTCIVSNQPTDDELETYTPATLIVAPATSLRQWEEETKKHTDIKHIGAILQYRDIKKLPLEMLKSIKGVM